MATAKETLMGMMSPQQARLLDNQMRQKEIAQRSQGAGMLSGLVQAYTGMADTVQGAAGIQRPMGANEQQAMAYQKKLEAQKQKQDKEVGLKRSVANVMTAQFQGNPVEVINKRIELLNRMTAQNPYAVEGIKELEKRREELAITEAELKKTGAQTKEILTDIQRTAKLNNLTDAQIKKIDNDITTSGLEGDLAKLRLEAEAKKLSSEASNLTGQVGGLTSYLKSRTDLSQADKDFYVSQVASKGMKVSDVYDIIKPLSEKEKASTALDIARANDLNSKTGGVGANIIKPQHRSSLLKSLKENGVSIDKSKVGEFLANGDKTILTGNVTIDDAGLAQTIESINSTVEVLPDTTKQAFYSERNRLLADTTLTPSQRAIKETEFLENVRQEATERQYNATRSSFETVKNNMSDLRARINENYGVLGADGSQTINDKFSTWAYVGGEVFGFHLPNSPERAVYNVVKTLKSNAMLETMKELKRLSSTGATGLGATNMKEVEALETKMRTLDPLDASFLSDAEFIMKEVERLAEMAISPPPISSGKAKETVQIGGMTVEVD